MSRSKSGGNYDHPMHQALLLHCTCSLRRMRPLTRGDSLLEEVDALSPHGDRARASSAHAQTWRSGSSGNQLDDDCVGSPEARNLQCGSMSAFGQEQTRECLLLALGVTCYAEGNADRESAAQRKRGHCG